MNRKHDVEKQWYWRRTIGDAARSGQPNSHPLRRFVQEIDSRGAGGSVTVGVNFLVHSWCTITCK
jgi:hypothetical protein